MRKDELDLFAFLGSLNKGKRDAYTKLSDEAKKAAHPLIIQRWLSSSQDAAQLVRLNEFVNPYVFSLGKEKDLLFSLIAMSCTAFPARMTWLKGPGTASTKLSIKAIMEAYDVQARDAEQYLGLMSSEDVLGCAERAGWTKEDIKKLSTELGKDDDSGSGRTQKVSSKSKKRG